MGINLTTGGTVYAELLTWDDEEFDIAPLGKKALLAYFDKERHGPPSSPGTNTAARTIERSILEREAVNAWAWRARPRGPVWTGGARGVGDRETTVCAPAREDGRHSTPTPEPAPERDAREEQEGRASAREACSRGVCVHCTSLLKPRSGTAGPGAAVSGACGCF